MATTTAPAPAPSDVYVDALTTLARLGFRMQTSVVPDGTTRTVWLIGPHELDGPFAVVQVGVRSGNATRAEVRMDGEGRPAEYPRGQRDVVVALSRMAVAAARQ